MLNSVSNAIRSNRQDAVLGLSVSKHHDKNVISLRANIHRLLFLFSAFSLRISIFPSSIVSFDNEKSNLYPSLRFIPTLIKKRKKTHQVRFEKIRKFTCDSTVYYSTKSLKIHYSRSDIPAKNRARINYCRRLESKHGGGGKARPMF